MIKKINQQLLLGLTGAFLVFGYSGLLATETYQTSPPESKNEKLLTQRNQDNVNNYLFKNKQGSYNFLKNELDEAVKDAHSPTSEKVVKDLWLLPQNNSKTETNPIMNNGDQKFIMISWIDATQKYNKGENAWKPGETRKLTRLTWVTASDQVKQFCHTCKGTGMVIPPDRMLSLRLEQYLGLNLDKTVNKTDFVEIRVKYEDLRRPCYNDPKITLSCTNYMPNQLPKDSFLNKEYNNSNNNKGYPFTGLGYTYDWGNNQTHVGATEFVINATEEKPINVSK